jgi:hypothetical protein
MRCYYRMARGLEEVPGLSETVRLPDQSRGAFEGGGRNCMHVSTPTKWMMFVDRATWKSLLAVVAGSTFCFALSYWGLSELNPENGLHYPEWDHAISLGDAIYFSVVTETTLGYGDFAPMGLSRALVVLQVITGLVLAGIIVARITSAEGRNTRLLTYRSSGDWLEYWRSETGVVMLAHATIFADGNTLRYNGKNFNSDGTTSGLFLGQLVDGDGFQYRFIYTNQDSATNFSYRGVCSLTFQPTQDDDRWVRYAATTHNFMTKLATEYKGRRATDDEVTILRGPDREAVAKLMRSLAETTSPYPDRLL